MRFTDTLCAASPEIPGSSACEVSEVSSSSASVKCKFKVSSTLHPGRNAYRIDFNRNVPGFFNANTFKAACSTLSDAIAAQTGTDPKLKPLCNHMSTGTAYCDYDSARFAGSYLTQCSASSNDATKCVGYPFEAVTYAAYFNTPNWNGENCEWPPLDFEEWAMASTLMRVSYLGNPWRLLILLTHC